MIGSFLTT